MNVLYSYHYLRKVRPLMDIMLEDCDAGHRVFIDSGAHTNHKAEMSGLDSVIPLDEYIADCKSYFHGRAWCYVTLDCPKEPAKSQRNLDRMLDAGLSPMPVLIQGEPVEKMAELVKIDGGRVCVAGGVKGQIQWCIHRYMSAFKASGGKAKIHALGFGRWPQMFQLPLASVDSNSWKIGEMYGTVGVYDRQAGMKFFHGDKATAKNVRLAKAISKCNIDADIFLDRARAFGANGPGTMLAVNAYFDMVEHADQLGLNYFLVVSSPGSRAMLGAIDDARTGPGVFDYPTARDRFTELLAHYKTKGKPK